MAPPLVRLSFEAKMPYIKLHARPAKISPGVTAKVQAIVQFRLVDHATEDCLPTLL